jgi:hypothetical protein
MRREYWRSDILTSETRAASPTSGRHSIWNRIGCSKYKIEELNGRTDQARDENLARCVLMGLMVLVRVVSVNSATSSPTID